MYLSDLFEEAPMIKITGITSDTRFLQPGDLFIPQKGSNFDEGDFIIEAIQKGAAAILTAKPHYNATIPIIVRKNSFDELKRCLKFFYGAPWNQIKMIGVTGTDGKTTTSSMFNHIINSFSSCAYIGTNGIKYKNNHFKNYFTTPPLSENYRLIDLFTKENIQYLALEVSSQGIVNHRIEDILFDYTIFTNLSHEHLDTQKTMENYFLSKLELFKQLKPKGKILVNNDDEYAPRFNEFNDVITFGIYNYADYRAENIRYGNKYTTFDLQTPSYMLKNIKINRNEEYNIYNVLPAIIIGLFEKMPINTLYKAVATIPVVDGRLELISTNTPFKIYIDFAHTPNALANVLSNLKRKTKGNLIVVCGAAGKKDPTKRPLIGKIACEIADMVIFTSEDPRTESPEDIIKDLQKEVRTSNYKSIIDRYSAIKEGISLAKPNDTVIVTGKGRETTAEIGDTIYNYSDVESIFNILNEQ